MLEHSGTRNFKRLKEVGLHTLLLQRWPDLRTLRNRIAMPVQQVEGEF